MKGKISAVLFKVMAVVSALAIGGVYVAWRQAEADKAHKREHAERAKTEQKEEDLMLMVGSKNPGRPVIGKEMTKEEADSFLKSYEGYIQQIPVVQEGAGDVQDVVPLLPGSKSISMPLFTKDQIKELPALEEEVDRELLPSSKIGILKLPQKEAEPSKKKDPKLLPGSKSIDWILDNPNRKKSE